MLRFVPARAAVVALALAAVALSVIGVTVTQRIVQSEPPEPPSGLAAPTDGTKTALNDLDWQPLPRVTDELTPAELSLAEGAIIANPEVLAAVAGHRRDVVAARLYYDEKRHETCRPGTRNCAEVGVFDYDANKAISVVIDLVREKAISVDFPPGPLAFPLSQAELDAAVKIALDDPEVGRALGGRDYRLNAVKQAHVPDVRAAAVALGATSESGESVVVFVVVDLSQRKVVEVQLLPTIE